MQLNFKPGKTECIVKVRGAKPKGVYQEIFDNKSAMLVPNPRQGSDDVLHVVRFYKHMGSIVDDGDTFNPELFTRITSTLAAFDKLRRESFKSKALGIQTK